MDGGAELLLGRLLLAAPTVGALAGASLFWGAVDRRGAAVGWLLGVVVWLGFGWRGFGVLAVFVAAGSAVTRLGHHRKEELGVAQERGGRRGARHALANAGVPALAGLASLLASLGGPRAASLETWGTSEPWSLMAAAALAAACSDTFSSEIGQAYGGKPRMALGGRRVPAGTDGAVSWVGSGAGLLGAAAIGGVASASGFVRPSDLLLVSLCGVLGNALDTLLGGTLERRGLLGNESVNFISTGLAGLLAAALAW